MASQTLRQELGYRSSSSSYLGNYVIVILYNCASEPMHVPLCIYVFAMFPRAVFSHMSERATVPACYFLIVSYLENYIIQLLC